jgi:O-antigen/teichoic acid export membrane protein
LVALLAGQVLNAAFGPVGNLIVLTGQQRKVLAPFAAALVFSLAANLVVIPAFGAVGAAVVRTIGILIWNAWMHLIVWRDLGVASNAFATSPVSARV